MNRFGIALVLTLTLGAAGCNTAPTPLPIFVGHVSDKTRPDQAGEHAERGIRLALHDLDKDGKLTEALSGRKLQARHTNTRGSLDAFEAEAVRLVSVNRAVALLGGDNPGESAALDHAQVPLIAFHGHRTSSKQVLAIGMTPSAQGDALAKYLAEETKGRSIVMLFDERQGDWSAVVEAFQKALPAGAKVSSVRYGWDPNWKDIAERMRTQKPGVVMFAGAAKHFNAWHRAFHQTPLTPAPTIVFAGEDGAAPLFDLDEKANVILATAFLPGMANEKTQAFVKGYQDAFKSEPDVHAALAYDGFRLLAEAIKSAQPLPSSERIREELEKTKDFVGVTGAWKLTAERQVQRPLYVVRYQAGKLKHLKTVEP